MKIVILQDRLRLGGTETQALALGQHWLDAGHDVRLIVFRPGGELAKSPSAKKLRVKVLQPFETGLDGWAPGLVKAVVALAPDVVVAFGCEANVKLARLHGLPMRPALVATLRSGREQPGRYWKGLRGADAVIANARWTAEAAARHGIAREKLHTIYNGLARDLNLSQAGSARVSWRQRAQTPADAVVLLCVASFRQGKGQDILLQAAAKLPGELNWQLWFAGDGFGLNSCKHRALQLKLLERVRFAGLVTDPAPLYAAADVAVLASEAEGLPNFLIEAQASGLPVVAVAVGGVAECFEEGKTGFAVPPDDLAALVAALTRAIRDADWRKAARKPAQARAAELFNPEQNAARWLEVFASLRKTTR